MNIFKSVKALLGFQPKHITIEGLTIRQIEQGLRKIGYSRSEALQVVCDLKKVIQETA